MGSNTLITYNAYNVTNATATTMKRQEQEIGSQSVQITYQLKQKIETNPLENIEVLKATSGNMAKKEKLREEMWATTRAKKLAEAVIM